MSQNIFPNIDPATTSGNALATLLNNFKDAVASGFSGTSRPPNLQAGGYWIDTSDEASPNFKWYYKIFDGTDDILVFTVNLQTNAISVAGTDSLFEILRVSADTTPAALILTKRRIANSGQVLSGDTVGEIQFVGRANDGSSPVVARMRIIASENETNVASGGYLVFEATNAGQAAAVEMMRLINGRLGIGLQSPEKTLHVRGGSMVEQRSDDAVGSEFIQRKSRIASLGAVLDNDVISEYKMNSRDDAGDEFTAALIKSEATEAHTATARGTKLEFGSTDNGAASPNTKMSFEGGNIKFPVGFDTEAITLNSQSIASTATENALSATKALAFVTGSTAMSVRGINASHRTKSLVVNSGSTEFIVFEHENVGATAANRLSLPGGRAFTLQPSESATFVYDPSASRWKLASIVGGGAAPLLLSELASAPATPASTYGILYPKADGKVYFKNDAGTEFDLTQTTTGNTYSEYSRVATQSIPNTGGIALFDTLVEESGTDYNPATGEWTCPTPGRYLINCTFTFDINATGRRGIIFNKNGSTHRLGTIGAMASASSAVAVNSSTIFRCIATDTVSFTAFQDSGGAVDLTGVASQNWFSIQRIGD